MRDWSVSSTKRRRRLALQQKASLRSCSSSRPGCSSSQPQC
uniref:Uncharacterized protein n=1 Tax=Rhizophora mucronata TaxID=61149 RepID=A0A2P2ISY3_RHIMU